MLTLKHSSNRRYTAIAALLATMMIQAAHSETSNGKHHFDIPAQSLNQALLTFGRQSQQQIMYSSSMTENYRSPALKGDYTTEEAIKILLSNSALQAVSSGTGSITVKPKPAELQNKATPADALPVVTVNADVKYDVNDPYNKDYAIPNTTTATKTDTPIMETPYSIAVVSQQVIKDQQAIKIEDALKNVAGVQTGFTNGGLSDTFMVRGFESSTFYRDGFLLPDGLGASQARRETPNIERVEVLKGPGSVLYGRSTPGGIINLVTKRPQATPYHSIQQQFGSYDRYRTTADSTGAITSDNKLLYRANLSYENANSFRDFVKTDSFFVAPSLTWNVSDQTQINMNVEYNHFDNTNDSGIPPIGNRPAPVPRNRQIGEPKNNSNVGDRTYVGFDWTHEFNDNWKIAHRFGAEFLDVTQLFTFFFGQPDALGNLANVPSSLPMGKRGSNNGTSHQQEYFTTLNLTGKFDTGPVKHTMLWGFDYFVNDVQFRGECCALFPSGATFNIYNPTYSTIEGPHNFEAGPDRNTEWYGLYWQDQIKFPFNIYGNVGVRYDNATGTNDGKVTTADHKVSPRGGLLWQPQKWLAVYGNYSENFGPSNSFFQNPDQQQLPPQTAEEWELGAKTEFMDGRFTASFAYFDLTKNNLPAPDPLNPVLTRTIGQQETKGIELEASGEILPGWRAIGAYTNLTYAKINKDVGFDGGSGDTGHRLYGTPHSFGSLWNTYEFQNTDLRGLKVGGGVVASGKSYGSFANDYQLPGYVTMNLMASYGLKVAGKNLTFQLNANNLLDKTYYQGTNSDTRIGFGSLRTFMGAVKLEF